MEIKTKLKQLNNHWNLVDNKLIRSFKFKDFEVTFNFMKEIAILSERLRHHPSWTNTYNKLEITLWTHDIKGLSDLDFEMAKKIDVLFDNFNKSWESK